MLYVIENVVQYCVYDMLSGTENQDVVTDNHIDQHSWRSCCNSKIDRRATIFFSHFLLALFVVLFSCYQLVHLQNCEAQSLYSGIITFILGIYCPSPKLSK